MVELVQLLARYNAHANTDMNTILAALSPDEWTKERGGFYPSIHKLAAHIYTADLAWTGRFAGLRPFRAIKGALFDFPPSPQESPFETFAEYLDKRNLLDAAMIGFASEVTEADLTAELSYRNFRGDPYTKNFGGLVLHVFNHATHHRGMIALYLDQMGVKNDFSNLSNMI
jgi:uncharacterized damage-inducible protein DinB